MRNFSKLVGIMMLVVAFCFCCAYAESDQAYVNVEGLKNIEEVDNFAVKIAKKEIKKDVNSFTTEKDALVFTIKNDAEVRVSGITIYAVAYDDEYVQHRFGLFDMHYGDPEPQMFSADGLYIDAGTEKAIALQCNSDEFTGVRAIVAAYTDANGSEYKNANADEWLYNVFGENAIQTIIFD